MVTGEGFFYVDEDIVRSRRAVIDVLTALGDQRPAFTVIGAHAVAERTRDVPGVPPDDSTRDADLGLDPHLLTDQPRVDEIMARLGFEPAHESRPGVWGLVAERGLDIHARLTVDLIAPASVAGSGRRSADVGKHGQRTASRTEGTELSLIDRDVMTVRSFDDGDGIDAYVAGGAALICAKAYKVIDRLDPREHARNPDRLRPKDFADLYRLLIATTPSAARAVFDEGEARDDIAEAVAEGRRRVIDILGRDDGRLVTAYVMQTWADYEPDAAEVRGTVRAWAAAFAAEDA